MHRGARWLNSVILFAICLTPVVSSDTVPNSVLKDSIERYVQADAELDLFSGAILVSKKDEIIYSGAFGLENRKENISNKLATKFNLGSIGKTFTAILIMQMVENGQIKLSDPLEKYLPDFPHPEKNRIQIIHLLTHSSGLGNYFSHKDYEARLPVLRKIDDALPLVYDQELLSAPGQEFNYSNSGMLILGAIIEKVSGMSYREYLKKQILKPAGMDNSGIFYPEEEGADRAVGYSKIGKDNYKVETEREFPAFSDGGLYSTVEDMLKYDKALQDNRLLNEETKELMFSETGPNNKYSLGWEIGSFKEEKFVGHVGGCYGFAADFIRFPEKRIMIIVLSNYTGTGHELAAKIRQLVFTEGKADIPLPSQYDFNFKKGRNLSELRKEHKQAVKYFDENITGDSPHMPSLFAAARARIFGNFEVTQAIELLDRYLLLGSSQSDRTKAAVWWLKGQAYEQLDKKETAIECYEMSLDFHSGFERSIEALQKINTKIDY